MASLDELWAWLYEPLRELAIHYRDDPDADADALPPSFLERLGLGSVTDHPLVEDLSQQLTGLAADERRALLADEDRLSAFAYEIAGHHAAAEPESDGGTTATDEDWFAFLAENGPHWDGQEESWAQFREWFAYHAQERGLDASADGFLAAAESGDKHAVFAAYGIAVPTPAAVGDPTALATQLTTDVITPLVAQLRAESPLFADLDDEQLRAMVGESLAHEIGRRAGAGQGR
jgi:hypothetical protein